MGVRSLELFGSLARGDARPASDVDLLVEFQPVGLFQFFRVQRRLEAILGRRVDLVMMTPSSASCVRGSLPRQSVPCREWRAASKHLFSSGIFAFIGLTPWRKAA